MIQGWLIGPPSPFSPRSDMEAFLKQMETHPGKDSEEVQYEVAKVRGI
jgi:hypothetical protein